MDARTRAARIRLMAFGIARGKADAPGAGHLEP